MKNVSRLCGVIKNYDWGGKDFLPNLIGIPNPERKPFAEYWMGTHPGGAAVLLDSSGKTISLLEITKAEPEKILGAAVAREYGSLPYLFKVLDAEKMLSIQAHPTAGHARAGFERENQLGISFDAPSRNYKDSNSKPEVHVALTDFYMLHGFRNFEEIKKLISSIPAFRPLTLPKTLKELYTSLMTMDQQVVNSLLGDLLADLGNDENKFSKEDPHHWAIKAAKNFKLANGNLDRGIFSIYLLNLLKLTPGQGTFQGAGELHAYLEGVTMELMANSDNVLRGGLTPKHVDVPELLRTLTFEEKTPTVLEGETQGQVTVYKTPAREFELSRIQVLPDKKFESESSFSAEILIITQGSVEILYQNVKLKLGRGNCFFVPSSMDYQLFGTATLYKAAVPQI